MPAQIQKDNSTYKEKVALRLKALDMLEGIGIAEPVVMETHGGEGHLYKACYAHLDEGVVFETDAEKVHVLARQRVSWSVYKADSTASLAAGAGAHLSIQLLDADPYGSPWDVLKAFFGSARPFAKQMAVVVNDGMRQKLATNSGWEVAVLEGMVQKYGNHLHPIYLQVCEELLGEVVAEAGYKVMTFGGYYTGHAKAMTHYLALLEQA